MHRASNAIEVLRNAVRSIPGNAVIILTSPFKTGRSNSRRRCSQRPQLIADNRKFKQARPTSGMPVINGVKPPDYADVTLEKEVRGALPESAILEGIAINRDPRGNRLVNGETVRPDRKRRR